MNPQSRPDDDLFAPSITNEAFPNPAPFRAGSTFFVGFFGGPVAATIVAVMNGQRLGISRSALRGIVLVGLAGLLATGIAAVVVTGEDDSSVLRFTVRVAGALTAVLQIRFLTRRERYWQSRGVEPASLWGVGFAAVVGGGILNAILVAVLSGAR